MNRVSELLRNLDLLLLVLTLSLIVFGIVMIYSATYHNDLEDLRKVYQKQMLWAGISLFAMIVAIWVHYKVFYTLGYLIYGVSILFLLLTLIVGTGERWVSLGPLRVQPSEPAKIALVFALAKYLSSKQKISAKEFFISLFFAILPMALVYQQPDLSTSLLFPAVLFPMLYWGGLNPVYIFFILTPLFSLIFSLFWWVLWLCLIIVIILISYLFKFRTITMIILLAVNLTVGIITPILWDRLHKYQQQRILSFLDPSDDPLGSDYQAIQSKIAIGSGGFWGKGFLQGTQTKLAFLPEQHTDFIFSVIGEETGFLGCALILSVFLLIIYRGISIASATKNNFNSLMSIGLVSILGLHVFMNVGMAIGLMPVAGLPLPFLSYGGTSLVTNGILVGLLLNVGMRRDEY